MKNSTSGDVEIHAKVKVCSVKENSNYHNYTNNVCDHPHEKNDFHQTSLTINAYYSDILCTKPNEILYPGRYKIMILLSYASV